MWWAGDYPFYFALRDIPEYDYYVLLEYDVHFPVRTADYINRLIAAISKDGDIDAVGTRLRRGDPGDICKATYLVYNDVYTYFFPLIVLSHAAVKSLLDARRLETSRIKTADELMHCEAFVATHLHHAGFYCVDVDHLLPGTYRNDTMISPSRYWAGVPLSVADGFSPFAEMVHKVLDDESFLQGVLNARGAPYLLAALSEPFMQVLSKDVREHYRILAEKHLSQSQGSI
jgi:hypothetical protein